MNNPSVIRAICECVVILYAGMQQAETPHFNPSPIGIPLSMMQRPLLNNNNRLYCHFKSLLFPVWINAHVSRGRMLALFGR